MQTIRIALSIKGQHQRTFIDEYDKGLESLIEYLKEAQDDECYHVQVREMSQEEFDCLPEFEGF